MNIQTEQSESKGSVYIQENGVKLAEMTYSIASPELIIIDHTEVSEALRGTGSGKKLLMSLVDSARSESFKILPLCPYAKSVFEKTESIRDVLK